MPFQDTMQVCLNGHVITDRYHKNPLLRKKFCTICGAETITNCPSCKHFIPGDIDYESIVVIGFGLSDAPKRCAECGNLFPWAEELENREQERASQERIKKEKEEEQKRLDALGRMKEGVNVHVGGQGNVVNLGQISDSIISNISKISKSNEGKIGESLKHLTEAVQKSSDLDAKAKQEHLEQLQVLSEEATKPAEKRLPRSILQPMINFGLGSLKAVADVAKVWDVWGNNISHFFIHQ